MEPPAIHAHTPSPAELGEPGPRIGSGPGHRYLPRSWPLRGQGKPPTPWQKQQHPGRTHFLSGPRWGPWPGAWGCCILHRQKVLWLPQGQFSLTYWPVAATPWFVLPRLLLVPGVSWARPSGPPMRAGSSVVGEVGGVLFFSIYGDPFFFFSWLQFLHLGNADQLPCFHLGRGWNKGCLKAPSLGRWGTARTKRSYHCCYCYLHAGYPVLPYGFARSLGTFCVPPRAG